VNIKKEQREQQRRKMRRRKRKMKVVHVAPTTPHQCGLYETARELVLAERELGINAAIFDPQPSVYEVKGRRRLIKHKGVCPNCKKEVDFVVGERNIGTRPPAWSADRGVLVAPWEFAEQSDVIVSHTGLDERFDKVNAPRIHVAHGRPNSSYRIERSGETPIYQMYKKMNKDDRWKVMVTLWPGFEHYWQLLFKDVRVFTPFVDLDFWKPTESEYDYGEHRGEINVMVADIWRKDKDPFHVIHAFALFAEKHPKAKLHMYGVDNNDRGRGVIMECLKERGVLGEVSPIVPNLERFYNVADMLITPHVMATRTIREAMACGLSVVAGSQNPYTPYSADPENLPEFVEAMERCWEERSPEKKKENRATAEREFDVRKTAQSFADLFKELKAA